MSKIVVDYDLAYKNHMKIDVAKAVKLFLNGSEGTCLTLYPQALNPFLKALENLCLWNQMVVIPSPMHKDTEGKVRPAYIVLKLADKAVSALDFD